MNWEKDLDEVRNDILRVVEVNAGMLCRYCKLRDKRLIGYLEYTYARCKLYKRDMR
jgi:hypothetical protein